MRSLDPSLLVILGGVSAALHVGKLPPALPALGEALGLTLVQAGFMLSLVQLAGMALGIVVGVAADAAGLKRTMVAGLLILSAAGFAGGFAQDVPTLLGLRAAEGFGFLLASMPAPSLVRRLVSHERLAGRLGLWGAYMPLGTALALLTGPTVIALAGWSAWWWSISTISFGAALWIAMAIDPQPLAGGGRAVPGGWWQRLAQTLSARGPWLVALCFALYSAQWLAVIGFLPSIYAGLGFTGAAAGVATALAAAVNIVGNVSAGRLLQRGVAPHQLLYAGFAAMALGGLLAFAPVWDGLPAVLAGALKYAAVLLFSMLGGLIPGTLFTLAVRLAPGDNTVATTVGWMQQWSSLGQFVGPPAVAWLATASGGWQWSWVVTGFCALVGLTLAHRIQRLLHQAGSPRAQTPR